MLSMDMPLLDIQMITPITAALGGKVISRDDFLQRLSIEIKRPVDFGNASKFPLIPEQTRLV
jgi:Leu/Phe-tRNA-protein transferase